MNGHFYDYSLFSPFGLFHEVDFSEVGLLCQKLYISKPKMFIPVYTATSDIVMCQFYHITNVMDRQ